TGGTGPQIPVYKSPLSGTASGVPRRYNSKKSPRDIREDDDAHQPCAPSSHQDKRRERKITRTTRTETESGRQPGSSKEEKEMDLRT
ncbi:hypothetical protein Trydic_g8483, partial [Trypoxylus dichotomus]